MLSLLNVVIGLLCLCFYFYGAFFTIKYDEPNLCKMTYMYEFPQFTRISFKDNDNHPHYALFGYSEGQQTENARNNEWTGAPVLFIPGNAGSFKQVRSLASVALRKGIANKWGNHLDYFSVDLHEEYSALYGGVLDDQTDFVGHSILKILDLYKNLRNRPTQVTIVGHSMGGKIAQALLLNPELAPLINTIICLATPMDKPVINLDLQMEKFYRAIEQKWTESRSTRSEIEGESKRWDDKLLITIGGGSRDVLVHSGLTASVFSDVHAQTSAIPNVWLSTDHKCSAWCLELVLTVNRFLYSILKPVKRELLYGQGHQFIGDKKLRLQKAQHYFENHLVATEKPKEYSMVTADELGDWIEDSRRVFSISFPYGINQTRLQMIRLLDFPQYKYLNVEVINVENGDEFLFGCSASEVSDNGRFCPKAMLLDGQNTSKLPSMDGKRFYVKKDLHEIKRKNPSWTHVLLRLLPTQESVRINVDVNEGGDRNLLINMPKWYSFGENSVVEDTILGGSVYTVNVQGIESPHQAIEMDLRVRRCSTSGHHAVAHVSVPWAQGHDRYHYFTGTMKNPLYVYVPTSKPTGFNTTDNPITVKLHLDPNCRYRIVMRNSFGQTLARIVQMYSSWLPAHIVVVLLLAFRYQISLTPQGMEFKCNALHKSLLKCSPFFIISAARLFIKLIIMTKVLPVPEEYDSILVSVIVHGTSLAVLSLAVIAIWGVIVMWGNVMYKVLFRLIQLPIPTMNILVPIIEKLPISAAVVLVSIAMMSHGGLALICCCGIYFILLTKMYEDFLEEFVYNTAKDIALKLFGRFVSKRPKKEEPAVSQEVAEMPEEPEISEPQTQEQREEQELNRLLKQTMEQQKRVVEEQKKEELLKREEYDAINEGLSSINFHMTLFIFLIVLTCLNLPGTITWAKNYDYVRRTADASLVPTLMTISSLAVIWQLNTPRPLIQGYKMVSQVLYGMALITIVYCLDSVYLLNNIIATIFALVALQQLFAFKTVTPPPSNPI